MISRGMNIVSYILFNYKGNQCLTYILQCVILYVTHNTGGFMYTYESLDKQLQGRCKTSRRVGNNTYLKRRGNDIAILYHATDIITYKGDNKTILVDCNGYRTVTTKVRLNEYLPCYVNQRNYTWYINNNTPFFDGMLLDYRGNVLNSNEDLCQSYDNVAQNKTMLKRINKYCKAVTAYIDTNGIPQPDSGDCWYCAMRDKNGITLGELNKDYTHLTNHMDEKYVHGSLIYNALTEKGYNADIHMRHLFGNTIQRSVRSYLIKRLMK